jgi:membrane protein
LGTAGPAAWPGALKGVLRSAAGIGAKIWKKGEADDILFLAGGVAFNILLAGLPFFLLLAAALGFIVGSSETVSTGEVARVIRDLFPDGGPGAGSIFDPLVKDIVRTRTSATLFGVAAFAWFSTRLFGSLRGVFNKVFAVPRGRHIVVGKLHDVVLTFCAAILLSVWIASSAYIGLARTRGVELLSAVGLHSQAIMGTVTYLSGRLITSALLIGIFYSLYTIIPNRKVRRGQALFGAVVSAALFEVARLVFALVITKWNPASLYSGTVAAIIVVVFWIYYAALIVIVGGIASQVREDALAAKLPA